MMRDAKLYDLTQAVVFSLLPGQGEKSLEIHFFKRVTGAYGGGQGANGQILNWSKHGRYSLGGRAGISLRRRAISDIPLQICVVRA